MPPADVDQLTTTGPSCGYVQISGHGADSPDGSWVPLQITVQDTTLVSVTGIPMAGGATGFYGRAVWGRAPGTTRIIGTHKDAADTIVVTVTAPATMPTLALRRLPPGVFDSPAQAPATLSLATGATQPVLVSVSGCQSPSLPARYAITFQSSNPAVVRVDNAVTKTASGQMASPILVAEAQLTAVGSGTAQVTASAPNATPTTYTVTVQ